MKKLALLVSALVLWAAPARAQHGASMAAAAAEAANQVQTYLESVAKNGARPDLSKRPVSDQLRVVFDAQRLAALPPRQASDVAWLVPWTGKAQPGIQSERFAPHDTSDVCVMNVRPAERPQVMNLLARIDKIVTDEETRTNLAAIGTALAAAK